MHENVQLSVSDFQFGLSVIENNILDLVQLTQQIEIMDETVSLKDHLIAQNVLTPDLANSLNIGSSFPQMEETLLTNTMSVEVSGFNTKRLTALRSGMRLDKFDDRFQFIKPLGKGGMGEVFEVRDEILQRSVALKRVRVDRRKPENDEKLLIEAQITGMLEHPSIVPVYDLRNDKNGRPFYVMRVVEEQSLKGILNEMRAGLEPKYSLTQLISILRQVALAIQYAHDSGVIHRDLKPENILIGKYGEVYIIDWGVALILDGERSGEKSIVGTPNYLSPEQARGDSENADFRTDIYALGTLLYEILCLKTPFRGTTLYALLYDIVFLNPALPSTISEKNVPEHLEQIAMRALRKEPNQRFQIAEEFAEELEMFLDGIKEKEKKRKLADLAIAQGKKIEADYRRTSLERKTLSNTIDRLRKERKNTKNLWDQIEHVEYLEYQAQQLFNAATHQYTQALVDFPDLKIPIEKLGALYWERFRDAEQNGDLSEAAFFESLVRRYNDGRYDRLLDGYGTLNLVGGIHQYSITISKYISKNGALTPQETISLKTKTIKLLHGSYVLAVSGYEKTIRLPFVLDRCEIFELNIPNLSSLQYPDDFVYVPAGEFLMWSGKTETARTVAFAIQKFPVTVGQYLEFINETDAPLERLPNSKSSDYFILTEEGYQLPESDAEGDSWDERWPIISINYLDAAAYCNWKSEKEGRNYQLPTLTQWMKAARGVDGRVFPWGRHFSHDFCQMRDTDPGRTTPAIVGRNLTDKSPYGAFDMCGNIAEWTTSFEKGTKNRLLGGASYNTFEELCHLNFVFSSNESYKFGHYGFRLILNLEPS